MGGLSRVMAEPSLSRGAVTTAVFESPPNGGATREERVGYGCVLASPEQSGAVLENLPPSRG